MLNQAGKNAVMYAAEGGRVEVKYDYEIIIWEYWKINFLSREVYFFIPILR